jgi:hypothetical protein
MAAAAVGSVLTPAELPVYIPHSLSSSLLSSWLILGGGEELS